MHSQDRAVRVSVQAISSEVARVMELDQNRVFTSSTGVIGQPLPHDRIIAKLEELKSKLSPRCHRRGRRRDHDDRYASRREQVSNTKPDGGTIRIAGFAKGSGMIAPDMATMLVYIFTDAEVAAKNAAIDGHPIG